tara:strand:+ start:1018 stop:1257 length:240 start_codon:yes stop_codon:yes gene_type:complete
MGKVKGLLMDMEDDVYSGMTYKQFTDKWGESKAHVKIWNEHCDPSVTKVNTDTPKKADASLHPPRKFGLYKNQLPLWPY